MNDDKRDHDPRDPEEVKSSRRGWALVAATIATMLGAAYMLES